MVPGIGVGSKISKLELLDELEELLEEELELIKLELFEEELELIKLELLEELLETVS